MDIMNKEFKKGMRGYSIDEVDEFLEKIAEDYEAVFKENAILKEKIEVFQDKLEHYTKIENTIQSTLLLAQNAADQAKQTSQQEADMIIRNANDAANKILDKAHLGVLTINEEFDRTKQEFAKFRSKYRNFLNTQMDMFQALERDFDKNYNISTTSQGTPEEKPVVPAVTLSETDKLAEAKPEEKLDYDTAEIEDIKSFFVDKE